MARVATRPFLMGFTQWPFRAMATTKVRCHRRRMFRSRPLTVLAVAAAVVVGTQIAAPSAGAFNTLHACETYNEFGSPDIIYYNDIDPDFGTPGAATPTDPLYKAAARDAALSWNASVTAFVQLAERDSNYRFTVESRPMGWGGPAGNFYHQGDLTTCRREGVGRMLANQDVMDFYTFDGLHPTIAQFIYTHEFGHAFGLADRGLGTDCAVMGGALLDRVWGGSCYGVYNPQNDDINGVAYRHPLHPCTPRIGMITSEGEFECA